MNTSWKNGAPWSAHNAFTGACLESRPPAARRAKSGPKAKGLLLDCRGEATVSIKPRRSTLEIFPSNCANTTRIMRAGI